MALSVYPGGITVHINSDLPRWKSKEVFPVLYFTGMLKKALSTSIAGKHRQYPQECLIIRNVDLELQDLFIYSSDVLCKSPSFPIGFLYWKVRRITGARAWN